MILSLPDYLTPNSTTIFSAPSFLGGDSALTVQNAIEGLANVISVDVSRTPSAAGVAYFITFRSNLGFVPLLSSLNALVAINEVQRGVCDVQAVVLATDVNFAAQPTNGTFTIAYEGLYTVDISASASDVEMKAALEGISSIGTVLVVRTSNGNGFRWTVSFTDSVGDLRLLTASPYRYEVQQLATTGGNPTPLSGLLTLSLGGDSVTVNYDASAYDLQAALESMPSVGACEVSLLIGSNGQNTWSITYRALIGQVDLLSVDVSMLFGSNAQATVSEIIAGNNQTLVGFNPRLTSEKVVAGRPDYTGQYMVDVPGNYEIRVSELTVGGLAAAYWDNQWMYGSPGINRIDPSINFDWSTGLITQFSYGKLHVLLTLYVLGSSFDAYFTSIRLCQCAVGG